MKKFGEILRFQRLEKGLPLRKVAAALDIDPSILSKIERGERAANKMIIADSARYLGLDEKELLTQFYSDKIAYSIYHENACDEILKAAEEKVQYLKLKHIKSSNFSIEYER